VFNGTPTHYVSFRCQKGKAKKGKQERRRKNRLVWHHRGHIFSPRKTQVRKNKILSRKTCQLIASLERRNVIFVSRNREFRLMKTFQKWQ
jgi:hypothetical protein